MTKHENSRDVDFERLNIGVFFLHTTVFFTFLFNGVGRQYHTEK